VPWIDDARSRIESIAFDARLDLAELLVDRDRHVEALTLLEHASKTSRLSERACRVTMRAHSMLGNDDGVVVAFRNLCEVLAEIGLEPSRTTVELARVLRR
jgi:thioredoxin-like negative regulator of GroEL